MLTSGGDNISVLLACITYSMVYNNYVTIKHYKKKLQMKFSAKIAKDLAEHATQVAFEYPQFQQTPEIIDDWMNCQTEEPMLFTGDDLYDAASFALNVRTDRGFDYQEVIDATAEYFTK